MTVATSLTQAVQLADRNMTVHSADLGQALWTAQIVAFTGTLVDGSLGAVTSETERTVINWYAPFLQYCALLNGLSASMFNQSVINTGTFLVIRVCSAGVAAAAAGRITPTQENSLLSAYNNYIAFIV